MRQYTLALVDDHQLLTESLTDLINKIDGFSVTLIASNGRALMEKLNAASELPDILLLDVSMPEMDGYVTARWLREKYPSINVLALSTYHQEHIIVKMLRLGCRGYLMKDVRSGELKRALEAVMQHGYYFSEVVTGRLIHDILNDKINGANKLTDREVEFLKCCTTEMTYKEISDAMNISVKTVEGYRESLFQKLKVKSRIGLVLYAIKEGLVEI
jgi:two-component system, NarL family, invasion response regulator UvrY